MATLLLFLVFLACLSPSSGRPQKTYTFKEPGKTQSTLALLYVDTSVNNGDPLVRLISCAPLPASC